MAYVLDACAVIAWLRGEEGGDVVDLAVQNSRCVIHATNLCEVYYDTLRVQGSQDAVRIQEILLLAGIGITELMSWSFVQRIGNLKVQTRISLGDCFVVALAQTSRATILTSDRKEFGPLADSGLCKVEFIR